MMKRLHLRWLLTVAFATCPVAGTTLYEAISPIPSLSNFTVLYAANSDFANALFLNASNYPITVLIPNNDAFSAYQSQTGLSIADLGPEALLPLIQYHTLVSSLSADNFSNSESNSGGLTTPTLLVNDEYNNRSVGSSLASRFGGPDRSKGQVVFIAPASTDSNVQPLRFRLSRRQADSGRPPSTIRSGLSNTANLTALDETQGSWDGGRFHIIDALLTPPAMCSKTIRAVESTNGGLDRALNRSGLWPQLDSARNVTCLGPSNEAWEREGNPDRSLSAEALAGALLFHTLPEVAYSDYLEDGMEFRSLQNGTVRVKVEGQGQDRKIWFNNAKVVDANVLTHNGLMHVLDAVMKPLEELNATASGTPTEIASATGSATSTTTASGTGAVNTGAAVATDMDSWSWGLTFALIGIAVMLQGGGGQWLLMVR